MLIFFEKCNFSLPLQNPVDATMGSEINQVAPKCHQLLNRFLASILKTLKHEETPSGLGIRFVHVLRCFAFSNLCGTVVKRKSVFSCFCGCDKYIEKLLAERPFGIQWAPIWHTESSKWRQNGSTFHPYAHAFLRS